MRLGMVIDLRRCAGCGACALACKAENNTRNRNFEKGQSFNWADFVIRTEGKFPDVRHIVLPVLCNHCMEAPCIEGCPTKAEPVKAIYKTPEGITMYDPARCLGCGDCLKNCPYSREKLGPSSLQGEEFSVISLNGLDDDTQPEWSDKTSAIPGCTASGAETAERAGARAPAMNQWHDGEIPPVRNDDCIEKCTFCYHRVQNGLQPACVEACPARARIFGDQDDPKSEISRVLRTEKSFRLLEAKGTKPNVHYIGRYSQRA